MSFNNIIIVNPGILGEIDRFLSTKGGLVEKPTNKSQPDIVSDFELSRWDDESPNTILKQKKATNTTDAKDQIKK